MENKDRFVRTSLTDSCGCVDFLEISELLEIATSSSIIRFDSGGQRRGKDGGVSAGLQRCACVQQHIKYKRSQWQCGKDFFSGSLQDVYVDDFLQDPKHWPSCLNLNVNPRACMRIDMLKCEHKHSPHVSGTSCEARLQFCVACTACGGRCTKNAVGWRPA